MNQYSDAYQYERAEWLGASKSSIQKAFSHNFLILFLAKYIALLNKCYLSNLFVAYISYILQIVVVFNFIGSLYFTHESINSLVIIVAEYIEDSIPIASVIAKPLTAPVPNI